MTTPRPYAAFYALRSLAPNVSEIHLVGMTDDAIMTELTTVIRSHLEAFKRGEFTVTPLGDAARWQGLCVAIDDDLSDAIWRQTLPRLHDQLASWIKDLYPNVDVVWRPR